MRFQRITRTTQDGIEIANDRRLRRVVVNALPSRIRKEIFQRRRERFRRERTFWELHFVFFCFIHFTPPSFQLKQ